MNEKEYSQLVSRELQDDFYKNYKKITDQWGQWLPKMDAIKLDGRFTCVELRKIADLLQKYEI